MVYSLEKSEVGEEEEEEEESPEITARLVRRSLCHHSSTMYLNLYKNHFSYIKSLARYSKSYQCSRCGKYWKHAGMLHRHEQKCEAKTRLHFPGGAYTVPPTIFDHLADEGIEVPERMRYYPYFATYDFECLFNRENLPHNTEKLTWENKHVPLSASICSNVPGFTNPKCLITTGDSHDLLKSFVDYLVDISQESYRLLLNDFEEIFTAIDDKIGETDEGVQEMVALFVGLEEDHERGIDVVDSDDEDEEQIESENEEDRDFINDGSESEEQDANFYRALNQELPEPVWEERTVPEQKEKKKKHPLVKLKVILYF